MYFDAHSDIWSDVTARRLRGESDILRKHHLPRLRKGNVEGSIFVIWVDPPFDADPALRTKQIIDCATEEISECDEIAVVHNYQEMERARESGKFYVFLGIEGLAAIGEDLTKIDDYYNFGCRHAMLSWNEQNPLATGVLGDPDRGLTPVGRQAVKYIQEKHMLMDVSHLNEKSFWDVIDAAAAPVIASHSNSKAMCSAPRNLSDEQLRAIRDTGGVVGLNAFNLFIADDPTRQTVENLALHAAHMMDVMGIDHVGCGFDFFEFINGTAMSTMTDTGSPSTIGLEDCSKISNLFACFANMGMTQAEMEKIAFRNFHRVIRESIG